MVVDVSILTALRQKGVASAAAAPVARLLAVAIAVAVAITVAASETESKLAVADNAKTEEFTADRGNPPESRHVQKPPRAAFSERSRL